MVPSQTDCWGNYRVVSSNVSGSEAVSGVGFMRRGCVTPNVVLIIFSHSSLGKVIAMERTVTLGLCSNSHGNCACSRLLSNDCLVES